MLQQMPRYGGQAHMARFAGLWVGNVLPLVYASGRSIFTVNTTCGTNLDAATFLCCWHSVVLGSAFRIYGLGSY